MLDWNDLRYFLAVHRAGTLAGAAATLGTAATTVGRRLAALEERVSARLFDRTPAGYVLTGDGEALLPRAERIEREILEVERTVVGSDQRLEGVVRVTATEMFATRFLAPHLHHFHRRYPDITIDLHCTTRSVDLARREADVAIRLARPHEDNLITRRLGSIHLGLYAATAYLERRGMPEDAERSLAGHDVVLFADSGAFRTENRWLEARLEGARILMRSDSVSSVYAATLAGLGIALLPMAVAEGDASLVHIATQSSPEPRVVWQTVHPDLQHTARVRAVLDFLVDLSEGWTRRGRVDGAAG